MSTTTINPDLYHNLADRIHESCDITGEFDLTYDNADNVHAHVIGKVYSRPDGPDNIREVYDVALYWAALTTYDEEGNPTANDFSISELKHYIIGN